MRQTRALVEVALQLIDDPFGRHWGYDLSVRSGVRSGVMYPLLHRMLEAEWLTDGWDDSQARRHRPPRRYYELTDLGRRSLGDLLEAARCDARFTSLLSVAGT
jgi:PadR family transcriptional regulator PadR